MRGSLVVVVAVATGLAGLATGRIDELVAQDRPSGEVDLTSDRLVDLSHSFNSPDDLLADRDEVQADRGRRR